MEVNVIAEIMLWKMDDINNGVESELQWENFSMIFLR